MQRTRTLFGILTLGFLFALSGAALAHDDHHDRDDHGKEYKMKEGSDSAKQMHSEGHEYKEGRDHYREGSDGEHAGAEYKEKGDHHGEYSDRDDHHQEEGSNGMRENHH